MIDDKQKSAQIFQVKENNMDVPEWKQTPTGNNLLDSSSTCSICLGSSVNTKTDCAHYFHF